MEKSGSGITYLKETHSDEMRVFRGGLKSTLMIQTFHERNKRNAFNTHDFFRYGRGLVLHSRSRVHQYFNYHYMFGGFKKYFLTRQMKNYMWKRVYQPLFLPILLSYTIQCISMRDYDNKSYNFFYFSD